MNNNFIWANLVHLGSNMWTEPGNRRSRENRSNAEAYDHLRFDRKIWDDYMLYMKNKGESNLKSFMYGVLSGVVEPLGALLIILFGSIFTTSVPYYMSFAAGAMIYVVVEELIPESQNGKHSNIATVGVMLGFVLMMILDVVLG